ncbi:MAG: DUF6600 domain-containing protein [Acidobacteriota bacterium]
MKGKIFIGMLLLTLTTTLSPAPAEAHASVSVGFSFFYDEMAPYGQWVTVADYGEVWCPRHVAVGWQPYLNGRWIYTEYGWTWVSFDPWGGDPYHYGTWVFTGDWGWAWIPGTTWAPAWVTWCDYGDYIGWAPVPPSFSIGLVGYSGPAIVDPPRSYVFVPTRSFVGADVRTVRLDPAQNATLVSRGRRITSFAVSDRVVRTGGPQVSRIQKVTGTRVQPVSLSAAKTRPAPIAATATRTRALSVVAPARERAAMRQQAEARGGKQAPLSTKEAGRTRKPNAEIAKERAPKKVMPAHSQLPSQSSRELSKAPPRRPEPRHQATAHAAPRQAEPRNETKAQAPARKPEPRHETKAQAAPRRPEPPHQTMAHAASRRAEPPHVAKAQVPPRRPEPPHQTVAHAAPRRAGPPHEARAQAPPRRPEPPHVAKARAPATKNPKNPGS